MYLCCQTMRYAPLVDIVVNNYLKIFVKISKYSVFTEFNLKKVFIFVFNIQCY